MNTERPEAREVARRLGILKTLEAEGLAVLWQEDLESLRADSREARRLHRELDGLRREITQAYQGDRPL